MIIFSWLSMHMNIYILYKIFLDFLYLRLIEAFWFLTLVLFVTSFNIFYLSASAKGLHPDSNKSEYFKFESIHNTEECVKHDKIIHLSPYENFYFAETCCTDSQTFKSWRNVKK